MAVKKCCIDNCNSCSTRKEDRGVTYHKFPKSISIRHIWITVTHNNDKDTELPKYVCSRHFCKTDFQIFKDSKYKLRSDAVPSIFPWDSDTEEEMEEDSNAPVEGFSKDCEIENVDAIKKFIEAQEKEIQEQRLTNFQISEKSNDTVENKDGSKPSPEEPLFIAGSVVDMILNESELEIAKKKDIKSRDIFSAGDKGSMALSIGSKVEAKDFSEEWHTAKIIEVDYEDMEVLVHYELDKKKLDEWISVSSPRLRPVTSSASSSVTSTTTVKPGPSSEESISDTIPIASLKEEAKDVKLEDKPKLRFAVGERCLARWRDNRRFIATILKDLEDGNYEILFDDGCRWTCTTSRLYKLKKGDDNVTATPLQYGAGPSNATPVDNTQFPAPAFHTHLFDPTRDYLGTKSERREMKRKLNIKEIFNIGQKRPKKQKIQKEKPQKVVEKKTRVIKKKPERVIKLKLESEVKSEVKTELPDAVASIIGTVTQEEPAPSEGPVPQEEPGAPEVEEEEKAEVVPMDVEEVKLGPVDIDDVPPQDESINSEDLIQLEDLRGELDPVLEEEVKLEQFDKPDDGTHEEVIDRIKEVINKLEDGLNQAGRISSPKLEPKEEVPTTPEVEHPFADVKEEPVKLFIEKEKIKKVKKGKKLRLLREKKVKKQVEKVKNELEEVRKQVDEMRKQMLKRQELAKMTPGAVLPESFLMPGEWCCRWVDGQPVGTVSEIECEMKPEPGGKPPLPRRSVQVEDKRLPEGWTKHMVRRSLGHSAGKWDVVLVSPDNRRFHTKNEMRIYLENNPGLVERGYEHALTDFGVHLKMSRRMGWISHTPDGASVAAPLPPGTLSSTSPLVKRRKLSLKKVDRKNRPKHPLKMKMPKVKAAGPQRQEGISSPVVPGVSDSPITTELPIEVPPLEDGYVYVGSLKVQIIENLLRCPAEGCFKNFRNNTLLQMHIKHYHRELRKMLGATPKVLDLAYARTIPVEAEIPRSKEDSKIIKVKIPRPKREEPKPEAKEVKAELQAETTPVTPVKDIEKIPIPRSQDSPKLRQALCNKPIKRPRVLLPVRRVEPEQVTPTPDAMNEDIDVDDTEPIVPVVEIPPLDIPLDFESAISTHTVTKPAQEKRKKGEKRKKTFALAAKKPVSEDEDWMGMNSDLDTRSSFPGSGTPDSKVDKIAPASSEFNEENKDATYMLTENGERIKIVHMKREEIINCHCGFREEDGLMVQCELCLCWQHALCHNIQKECDVPDKYTCSICLNPRRGRRSQRFLHDQDRMFEGVLPAGKPCESLRRSHELAGNLLRIEDALHALRVKYYVATKKDHPKLYLWAKDWEQVEIQTTQEQLNSDYSDLNIMINSMDKENQPVRPEDVHHMALDIRTPPSDELEHERYTQREQLGSHSLLSGLLSSPGGASLDLPISTSELERLARTVQEQEAQRAIVQAPQPEAPIENNACRRQLLKHLQRCQALIETRLESIEAQVAELESQDPSLASDESPQFLPRTKQTVQMLMRDLDTMEDLGVIT